MFLSWWEMVKKRAKELAKGAVEERALLEEACGGHGSMAFLGLTMIMLPHLGLSTFLSGCQVPHHKIEGFQRVGENILYTYVQ